ncbi:MAG: hypothetical protein P4L84_27580 [Isosphaeraceae bacterium]|nr:hypothetical protein [Isosphaeraceae bacterium]
MTQPPPEVTAGKGFGLVVAVENSSGGPATGDDGATVTIALANNPSGATLGGAKTATVENGYAVFPGLSLGAAGSGYTIQATSAGLTSATTNPINVSLQATHLVVTTEPPASVAARTGFEIVVAAEDANGNVDTSFTAPVTLTIGNNPGGATLGGVTNLGGLGGVADFTGLTLNAPGNDYTLTAAAVGLTSAGTSGFNVTAAPATQLVVTTEPPASVVAGASFGLVVEAEDGSGDLDTSYNGPVTVALATNPGGATLASTLTVNASAGVASFTGLSLDKAGAGYTLGVTSGSLAFATTNAVTVTAAPATQLVITTPPPSSVTSGGAFALVVEAEDAAGNVDTSFTGSVTIALGSNPIGGTLGETVTVTR